MTLKTMISQTALGALASAALLLGGTAANAAVTYTFMDGSVSFSDTFAAPVTQTTTAAPVFTFGSFAGDVTYAPSVTYDAVSFAGQTYDFAPTAFTNMNVYQSTSGSAAFSTLIVNTVSAAPEPSSWALMTIGVGLMGLALRSRRRLGVAAVTA